MIVRPAVTVADGATSQISWAPGWTPAVDVHVGNGEPEVVGDHPGEHIDVVPVQFDSHSLSGLETRAPNVEHALLGDADGDVQEGALRARAR